MLESVTGVQGTAVREKILLPMEAEEVGPPVTFSTTVCVASRQETSQGIEGWRHHPICYMFATTVCVCWRDQKACDCKRGLDAKQAF